MSGSKKRTTDPPAETARQLGIGGFSRHVFLCAGPTCCDEPVGQAAWDALKHELKRLNLSLSSAPNACYRTKAGCLRVCGHGPVAVVYPEGTWYAGLTADRIPRFADEHLVRGQPIREWIFADNPLPRPSAATDLSE